MAALAAFSATGAMAGSNFAGVLGAGYDRATAGGDTADGWHADGSGVFSVGNSIHIEADGSYQSLSDSGTDLNTSRISGAAFWQGEQFRAGASIGYTSFDFSGSSFNSTNYGAFGEFFASDRFTIGAHGGWLSISDGGPDGTYLGGGVTFYAMPNLAIHGGVNAVNLDVLGDSTTWNASAEYLFSETTPISGFLSYSNSDLFGAGTIDTWSIGIKWYTNGDGASTLVDRQRSGAVGGELTNSGLSFL